MSAVEQAVKTLDAIHASTMRTARLLVARESLVAEAESEYRTVRDALIAAVRAERDAAWREGVEAAIAKVPRFRMVRQVKSATGYSVQMTHHDERKHKNEPKCVYGPDVVAALAALAARMEAK